MAITFPRDLPELSGNRVFFNKAEFKPVYQQIVAPSRGGLVQVANIGSDLWTMAYATPPLKHAAAKEQFAWLQSLRGGVRTFKAWDPLCRFPEAYPNGFGGMTRAGGGAFDGTCTLSAIGTDRDTITLTTLPANFVFTAGDMVSFPMGASSRCLVRVLESVTGSGAGAATLTVEPWIPLAASAGTAEVTLIKPWCLAIIDAGSISGPVQPGYVASVSFNAVQTY